MKTVSMFVEKNDQYEDVEVTDSDQESDSDPEPCSMPEATTEEAQLPPEPEDVNLDPPGVWTDLEAAEKLLQMYPHLRYCEGKLHIFDDKTGMWSSDKVVLHRIIKDRTDHLRVLKKDKMGGTILTSNSYGNTASLMARLPDFLKALCLDNRWLAEHAHTSLGKILFLNGFYDFTTDTFHPQFDPKILFVDRINRAFDPASVDDEYMQSVNERFFELPLGKNLGGYIKLNLARGLAGDMIKRMIFGLGYTNCGKTVLVQALQNSIGGYFGTFNGETLNYRSTSNDEAQVMRPFYLLSFKRIIVSNEVMVKYDGTTKMNGNMIKKISSGGDKCVARWFGNGIYTALLSCSHGKPSTCNRAL
jgi:hypothetical protein